MVPLGNWFFNRFKAKAQFTGYGMMPRGNWRNVASWVFGGEKNLGELGPPIEYIIDHDLLRVRSWQLFLESDIAQTVLKKYTRWVIGRGLKLQAEPMKQVLEASGINLDVEKFSSEIESRFDVYAASKHCDYADSSNLTKIQTRAHKNAITGGDVLVILRYIDDCIKIQLVDGAHVIQPIKARNTAQFFIDATNNKTRIENGIELSPTNKHIAYYVRKPGIAFDTDRILAYDPSSGLRVSYLVYGNEHRIDTMRGMPLLSVIMETIKKLERYKEATVGTAEELAKVSYQIVHQQFSTGESPLAEQLSKAHDINSIADLPKDINGRELANNVASTTLKQTYNMPVGAELKTINPNKYQLYFKDFYEKNIDILCACVGMPPDVAMSKYNSNYSASRAAIKDWEHTLLVEREDFSSQFMEPIYRMFMYVEMLKREISMPGLLMAWVQNKYMIVEAYLKARWSGAAVPHIDPLKEVQAERLKLGPVGANMPLTTLEAATEALNSGESDNNMEQFSEEFKSNKSLGIEPKPEELKPTSPKKAVALLNGQVQTQQSV